MIKCHLNISPSKECYEICLAARRCEALKMWESEVNRMTNEGEPMAERKMIYLDDAIEAIEEITWYHQNINNEMVSGANSSEHQAWYKADDVYEALEKLPSAQPEQKGEWVVLEGNEYTSKIIQCSRCKHKRIWYPPALERYPNMYNFCPNCGADMRKGESNG